MVYSFTPNETYKLVEKTFNLEKKERRKVEGQEDIPDDMGSINLGG